MKKLFKVRRIGGERNHVLVVLSYAIYVIICVLCDQSCVSCVSVTTPTPYRQVRRFEHPAHEDGDTFVDDRRDRGAFVTYSGDKTTAADVYDDEDEEDDRYHHGHDHEPKNEYVSEHETPRNIPAKVNLRGDLATPAPDSNIELDFVPKQTYFQVRRYDTEVHLPRSAALAEADTAEEVANAPRLREIVSHKKTQEVYEEQGYEDAAYDHGGYKKAGEHHQKNAPRDHKTDYSRITDQSTEQAEIISVGRFDNFTTKSSHSEEPQQTTTEPADSKEKRARKPTTTRNSWSRQKTTSRERSVKFADNGTTTDDYEPATTADNPRPARRPTSSSTSTPRRRRLNRTKSNFTKEVEPKNVTAPATETDENKVGQESKFHSTRKLVSDLRNEYVQPTTYRPPNPPRILTDLQRQSARQNNRNTGGKKKKTTTGYIVGKPIALISADGYRYENPFEHFKGVHDVKTSSSFPFEYMYDAKPPRRGAPMKTTTTHLRSAYDSRVRHGENESTYPPPLFQPYSYGHSTAIQRDKFPDDALKYDGRDTLNSKNFEHSAAALTPYTKEAKYKKVKYFPYQMENAHAVRDSYKTPVKRKKIYENLFKAKDFPYDIVSEWSTAPPIHKPSKYTPRKYPKSKPTPAVDDYKLYKYEKYPKYTHRPSSRQQNKLPIFGEPDSSPWIPITPKEVYDIHGYDRISTVPTTRIKVTESDRSVEASLNALANRKKTPPPTRLFDTQNAPPRTVSTSYTIHHEYPRSKLPADSGRQQSTRSNNYETFDDVENYPPNYGTSVHRIAAESANNLITYATTPMIEFVPSIEIDPSHVQSTVPKPIANAPRQNHVTGGGGSYASRQAEIATTARENPDRGESFETDDKDIQTLSSNRYSVYRRANYTLPMRETSTSAYAAEASDSYAELENSLLLETRKFLFRHPYLPRETSSEYAGTKIMADNAPPPSNATNVKRDVVLTRPSSRYKAYNSNDYKGNVTHLTKVSKRNDVGDKVYVVYPQDYLASAKYVEKLTLAHYSTPGNVAYNPLPLDYHDRLDTLTNHLKTDYSRRENARFKRSPAAAAAAAAADNDEELVNVFLAGTTTEIPVDLRKYPFYKTVRPDSLSKYSVIRYALNPNEIPEKRRNRMTFYDSRNSVECVEPSAPQNIVPDREDGEWTFDNRPKTRVSNLGDNILCFKRKFFGSDPLDNPFFKEEYVGFPEVFPPASDRKTHVTREFYEVAENSRDNDYELLPESWFLQSRKRGASLATAAAQNRKKRKNRKNAKKTRVTRDSESDETSTNDAAGTARRRRAVRDRDIAATITFGNAKSSVRKWIDSLVERGVDGERPLSSYELRSPKRIFENRGSNGTLPVTNDEPEPVPERNKPIIRKVYLAGGFINGNQNRSVIKISPFDGRTHETNVSASNLTRTRKKAYVDALSSLRSLRNSSTTPPRERPADKENDADATNFRYNYKEPSWRAKERNKPSDEIQSSNINRDVLTSVPDPDIDSLLYVIHPRTGEGKWMKLLQIDEIANSTFNDAVRTDTSSSSSINGNAEQINAIPYVYQFNNYVVNDKHRHVEPESSATNDRNKFKNKKTQKKTKLCEEDSDEENEMKTRNQYSPEYDIYHISGLLKQVAPLKGSEVEINNLQTTEGNSGDEDDDDDDDDSNDSSLYDLEDFYASTHFPEPHERLYYYVVDDGKAIKRLQ